MLCKKCLNEIPSDMPCCIYCGEKQDIEKNIEKITVEGEEKNMHLSNFTKQAGNFTQKVKMAPKKIKLLILCVFVCIVLLHLIGVISKNNNKIVGTWENGEVGYIIFTENGQFFVDNDNVSGEYEIAGSTLIMYFENGNAEYWEYDISNNILVMTCNNNTLALYRANEN